MGCADSSMADPSSRHRVLHWCLGYHARYPDLVQQNTYLVAARLRRRPRRAEMVSNVVGYVFARPLHPLGWASRTISRYLVVVVARCVGRHPRCGLGLDPASGNYSTSRILLIVLNYFLDIVSSTRLCHARLCPSHRFDLCHGRASNSTQ